MNQETQQTANFDSEPIRFEYGLLFAKLALAALTAFAAGWFITTAASLMVGYSRIPNQGEIRINEDGKEYFHAYYPDFRKYAITSANSPFGTEKSKFSEMGAILTGLYIYSISNAYHWMLELKIQNFGIILLIPFFTFIGAGILLYAKWLPEHLKIPENALLYTIGVSVIHAGILMIVLLIFCGLSPTLASLYDAPYVYVGQLLGLAFPSAGIILVTNVFFGAAAGGVISGLINLRLLPANHALSTTTQYSPT